MTDSGKGLKERGRNGVSRDGGVEGGLHGLRTFANFGW